MKFLSYAMALVMMGAGGAAFAQAPRDNSNRPCIDVNVQIDRNNSSRVNQRCGINMSRTMQAGENNTAETRQSGDVNDNEVNQYEFQAQQRRRR